MLKTLVILGAAIVALNIGTVGAAPNCAHSKAKACQTLQAEVVAAPDYVEDTGVKGDGEVLTYLVSPNPGDNFGGFHLEWTGDTTNSATWANLDLEVEWPDGTIIRANRTLSLEESLWFAGDLVGDTYGPLAAGVYTVRISGDAGSFYFFGGFTVV